MQSLLPNQSRAHCVPWRWWGAGVIVLLALAAGAMEIVNHHRLASFYTGNAAFSPATSFLGAVAVSLVFGGAWYAMVFGIQVMTGRRWPGDMVVRLGVPALGIAVVTVWSAISVDRFHDRIVRTFVYAQPDALDSFVEVDLQATGWSTGVDRVDQIEVAMVFRVNEVDLQRIVSERGMERVERAAVRETLEGSAVPSMDTRDWGQDVRCYAAVSAAAGVTRQHVIVYDPAQQLALYVGGM